MWYIIWIIYMLLIIKGIVKFITKIETIENK